jgi:hypothetical protein
LRLHGSLAEAVGFLAGQLDIEAQSVDPAEFILVAAMNLRPCDYRSDRRRTCSCTAAKAATGFSAPGRERNPAST